MEKDKVPMLSITDGNLTIDFPGADLDFEFTPKFNLERFGDSSELCLNPVSRQVSATLKLTLSTAGLLAVIKLLQHEISTLTTEVMKLREKENGKPYRS